MEIKTAVIFLVLIWWILVALGTMLESMGVESWRVGLLVIPLMLLALLFLERTILPEANKALDAQQPTEKREGEK